MQNKDQGRVGNEGPTAPVCAEAMDRLWQAAYGPVPGLAGGDARRLPEAVGPWRPYDAERPVIVLMRACIAHLDAAGHEAAARRNLQARLFTLSAWLCSDDARRAPAGLVAWAWDAGAWRPRAVHRDLVRQAASCASVTVALTAPVSTLSQAPTDPSCALARRQGGCACAATI